MSFEIIPVDSPLEKEIKRFKRNKALTVEEIWSFGWVLWKQGFLFRFRIKGATDMITPVTEDNGRWGSNPHKPTIEGCSWEPRGK